MRPGTKNLLRNILEPIDYKYDQLTVTERSLISKEEFEELAKELVTGERPVAVGDWVRFYKNGQLVIGHVNYIVKEKVSWRQQVCTDQGSVDLQDVLEVRKA